MQDIFDRELSKWPQMIVTGKTIPSSDALEIIRRTDGFFSLPSGNDREFVERAIRLAHMPECPDASSPEFIDDDKRYNDKYHRALTEYSAAFHQWQAAWGFLETHYIFNRWVCSSYIGGPYGWCHPDGVISFSGVIGKWPTIRDVYDDWVLMVREFPFLEVEVSILDADMYGEDRSHVVSMLIRAGKVTLVDPAERNIHEEFHRPYPRSTLEQNHHVYSAIGGHAISLAQIKTWGDRFEESRKRQNADNN